MSATGAPRAGSGRLAGRSFALAGHSSLLAERAGLAGNLRAFRGPARGISRVRGQDRQGWAPRRQCHRAPQGSGLRRLRPANPGRGGARRGEHAVARGRAAHGRQHRRRRLSGQHGRKRSGLGGAAGIGRGHRRRRSGPGDRPCPDLARICAHRHRQPDASPGGSAGRSFRRSGDGDILGGSCGGIAQSRPARQRELARHGRTAAARDRSRRAPGAGGRRGRRLCSLAHPPDRGRPDARTALSRGARHAAPPGGARLRALVRRAPQGDAGTPRAHRSRSPRKGEAAR